VRTCSACFLCISGGDDDDDDEWMTKEKLAMKKEVGKDYDDSVMILQND